MFVLTRHGSRSPRAMLVLFIAVFHLVRVGGFSSVSLSASWASSRFPASVGSVKEQPTATFGHSALPLTRCRAMLSRIDSVDFSATLRSRQDFALRQTDSDFAGGLAASGRSELQEEAEAVDTTLEGDAGSYRAMFSDVIPAWLIDRLEAVGFNEPTPVQEAAIKAIMREQRDALVQSYTGSGKTLAFLIPLLASLESSKGKGKKERRLAGVQAVVVAPTRELAMQLVKVARKLASGCPDATLHVMALSSDGRASRQRTWLKADPPQVVIGDPESLLKVTEAGTLRTGSVRFLVVDEVDACLLNSKTKQSLNRLLSRFLTTRKATSDVEQRRTVFASATVKIHQHFLQVCEKNKWMLQPKHVRVDAHVLVPPQLSHSFLPVPADSKVDALRALLRRDHIRVVLLFAAPSRPSWQPLLQALEEELGPEQLMVLDGPAARRVKTMARFREQEGRKLMVASDLAARGVDVPEISHVINFEMPSDWEMYCHRAGRAARNQREGDVITLLSPEELFVLERYANALSVHMSEIGEDGREVPGGRRVGLVDEEEEEGEEQLEEEGEDAGDVRA